MSTSLACQPETSIYDVSPPPESLIISFHGKAELAPADFYPYMSSTHPPPLIINEVLP